MSEHTPHRRNHFERHVMTTYDSSGNPKQREILVPDDEARAAHAEMLNLFYGHKYVDPKTVRPESFVGGGMPGSTILDNVRPHQYGRKFYKLDLKNAFPSVDIDILKAKFNTGNASIRQHVLEGMNFVEFLQSFRQPWTTSPVTQRIWNFIDEYATADQVTGLPLGAPASPYLFNYYLQDMDREIDAITDWHGLAYSRWMDDITISSPRDEGALGDKVRKKIRQTIESTPGMHINHAKSAVHSLANHAVTITGVSLYSNGRMQAAPHIIRNAHEAFRSVDEIALQAVFSDELIDPNTMMPLINGHHGALVGMSQKPYGPTITDAIQHYQNVARFVHNSAAIQEEPPDEIREEIAKANTAREVAREEAVARSLSEPFGQLIDQYKNVYPELEAKWGAHVYYLMALIVDPLHTEAFEAQDGETKLGEWSLRHGGTQKRQNSPVWPPEGEMLF